MRILYNHGLTVEDLYEGTPKRVIDKNWEWFKRKYGYVYDKSFNKALSDPFKCFLSLLMNYIIDNRIRFVFPNVPDTYIDFEILRDDKFEWARQFGRFQQIDFIESDFTGYSLLMTFRSKGYSRSAPIHLGGDLRRKFLDGINSGVKYYSKSDCKLEYFLPKVEKNFPHHTKDEIKKLLIHGIRRLHSAVKYGCAITVQTRRFGNCYFHIGMVYGDIGKQIKAYGKRWQYKLRKMYTWRREEFDGYYYIGLTKKEMNEWAKLNKGCYVRLTFLDVYPRKIKEELYYVFNHLYIFRFKKKKFAGWIHHKDKLIVRHAEYLGEVIDRKFYESHTPWKKLLKEYEEREYK